MENIFTGRYEQTFLRFYRRIFGIEEIEKTPTLQWAFGALLLTFFVSFSNWAGSLIITRHAYIANQYSCWPYFQSCGKWYIFEALPYGYSQSIFYSVLFGLLTLAIYLMWKKEWVLAHLTASALFAWKFLMLFVLTNGVAGNFEYYDIVLGTVLLFLPFKVYFLRLSFVLLYFLAVTIKFDAGWILGTYFTALETGLPIFGNTLAPIVTNIVIFMQAVGAWFLLSKHKILQRLALVFFLAFHLYSSILVLYRYPITTIPMLLILFGPLYIALRPPFTKKAIASWSFIAILCGFQFLTLSIAGQDRYITLEGNMYGLYMFEANHQCISHAVGHYKDGSTLLLDQESANARNRCNPYDYWFAFKQACLRDPGLARISWQFDHSINGGLFYRIIDTENICDSLYRPFSRNRWIKTPEEGAAVVGQPVENFYR